MIKSLNLLISNKQYQQAINILEKHKFQGNIVDRSLLFSYYFCLKKLDRRDDLVDFFAMAEKFQIGRTLEKSYADRKYISTYGFLFNQDTISHIESINAGNVCDDNYFHQNDIELNTDVDKLKKLIADIRNVFNYRYLNEYRYIKNDPINYFPYKYISDFSANKVDSVSSSKKTISFIYCIKNRSVRASLSLKSLFAAIENYSKNLNTLKFEVILVEDLGSDIIDSVKDIPASVEFKYYLVDTGVSWTRAGLLNFGIRRSTGDILSFCDVDFLFHADLFIEADQCLTSFDFNKYLLAINCIETHLHRKGQTVYSSGSPYGYMWMTGGEEAKNVCGFSEDFVGHGFEDRDFQYKVTRGNDLKIVDSLSLCSDLFVLHLSHNARAGDDRREVNKKILESKKDDVTFAVDNWGEQKLIRQSLHFDFANRKSVACGRYARASSADVVAVDVAPKIILPLPTIVDYLFIPHNHYHAKSFVNLSLKLHEAGLSCRLLRVAPPYPDEGAYLPEFDSLYIKLSEFCNKSLLPRAVIVMNDWETRIASKLIDWANSRNIATYALVEGVNDFNDVDTRLNRCAYQRVKNLFLNGEFDKKYFDFGKQRLEVVGIERLDVLFNTVQKNVGIQKNVRAIVNCNFTYGVLTDKAEGWVADVASACADTVTEMIISKHPADKTGVGSLTVSKVPLYEDLVGSEIFITRFSGAVFEALVAKCKVIYYNPGIEKIDKFTSPMGAYLYANSKIELVNAIKKIKLGWLPTTRDFLELHTGSKYEDIGSAGFSTEKTVQFLLDDAPNNTARLTYAKSHGEYYFDEPFESWCKAMIKLIHQ